MLRAFLVIRIKTNMKAKPMSMCLFLTLRCRPGSTVSVAEIAGVEDALGTIPRLLRALVHTPARAHDPFLDDGPPPSLVLQLYFAELPELEAALAKGGPLSKLMSPEMFPGLANAEILQQAMLVRPFAVSKPSSLTSDTFCTYLVAYEGEATDLNAWLEHYLAEHTRHMADLPGIRELEVYTRLDWVSALAWPRAGSMQRNKVVFDSPEALTHALSSPIREKMRDDYKAFPAFTGPNTHYAMVTRVARRQA